MKVNLCNRHVFGLVIPDMVKGPWADIASGIRQAAQRDAPARQRRLSRALAAPRQAAQSARRPYSGVVH